MSWGLAIYHHPLQHPLLDLSHQHMFIASRVHRGDACVDCCLASVVMPQPINPREYNKQRGGSKFVSPQMLEGSVSDGGLFSICAPRSWDTAGWIVVFMLMHSSVVCAPFCCHFYV